MKATILDTKTGLIKVVDGPRSFEWAEDGWSCDCNRDLWNVTHNEDECGTNRFLVIKAEMNDPEDYSYTLEELNECYPIELLKAHGIITNDRNERNEKISHPSIMFVFDEVKLMTHSV